jgi:hypothetical protein
MKGGTLIFFVRFFPYQKVVSLVSMLFKPLKSEEKEKKFNEPQIINKHIVYRKIS